LALEKMIPESVDKKNGRPGMDLWRILVFGTLRLVINCDFDRLRELAKGNKGHPVRRDKSAED
ncbi:MAG: hypothetical protein RM811_021165, partial [Endozoicomonas sp.]